MIARIWHGITSSVKAGDYVDFLKKTALPDYTSTPGNRGAFVLRRIDGERAHFLTLTFWESEQAIKEFAGQDMDKAKYYPEDTQFLLEFEPSVQHYEVMGEMKTEV
jgi:heme-degrading monooxygenase HmoA